jgi:hypothetical protein
MNELLEMTEMEIDYSKAAVLRFIETAQRQGLFNQNTAAGLRAAAGKLLEDVAQSDDVRLVDPETATIKYNNKHPGDLTPESLRTYSQRLLKLLDEFRKYSEDPLNYKPKSRPIKVNNGERPAPRAAQKADAVTGGKALPAPDGATVTYETPPTTTPVMAMSYPLRADFVAQVVLPRNLNNDEARRLCAFIRTLASDFVPEV